MQAHREWADQERGVRQIHIHVLWCHCFREEFFRVEWSVVVEIPRVHDSHDLKSAVLALESYMADSIAPRLCKFFLLALQTDEVVSAQTFDLG